MEVHERVTVTVAIIITVIWTASVVLDAAWRQYDPPQTIHLLMMAVAGWAFGDRYIRAARKRDRDQREE